MIWILKAVFILPVMAAELPWQGIQADAYNLHQALNYLNVYTSGKCDGALDLAKKHLGEIKEKPADKPFGEITAAVKKFHKPSSKDITDLESLRMKYGEMLEAHKIAHKLSWHKEIKSKCPAAPRVE